MTFLTMTKTDIKKALHNYNTSTYIAMKYSLKSFESEFERELLQPPKMMKSFAFASKLYANDCVAFGGSCTIELIP